VIHLLIAGRAIVQDISEYKNHEIAKQIAQPAINYAAQQGDESR
jgi:hypothetical protein